MKLIIAYIQPERLNAVKQALYAREVYKMSVSNALGCGQQRGYLHMYRGAIEEVTLLKKVRLAIAVNDEFVEKTVDAVIEGARTGDIATARSSCCRWTTASASVPASADRRRSAEAVRREQVIGYRLQGRG